MRIRRQRQRRPLTGAYRRLPVPTSQRTEERTEVDWLAWASLGGIRLGGRLRDVSSTGAFFEPRTDMSQPGLLESYAKRPLFERNDALILSYEKTFESPVQLVATVRWLGPSKQHGCYGLGVQFAAE